MTPLRNLTSATAGGRYRAIGGGLRAGTVSTMPVRERSQARVLALQALCLFDALGDSFAEQLDTFLADAVNQTDLGWTPPAGPKLLAFAKRLTLDAWQHRRRADELLRTHVVGWSVERMQPVDRSILRLGLYELLECPDTPPAVAINEAVELARRFGGQESPGFVNGVLDGLRRELNRQAGLSADDDRPRGTAAAPDATE